MPSERRRFNCVHLFHSRKLSFLGFGTPGTDFGSCILEGQRLATDLPSSLAWSLSRGGPRHLVNGLIL